MREIREQTWEEDIRNTLQQVTVPDTVQERMKKATEAIRLSVRTEPDVGQEQETGGAGRPHRAAGGFRKWKTVWVAAAVIACTGVSVLAGSKVYRFHREQKEAYAIEANLTTEEVSAVSGTSGGKTAASAGSDTVSENRTGEVEVTLPEQKAAGQEPLTEVAAVEMQIGYIPEGLVDRSADKGENAWYAETEDYGYIIGDPIVIDRPGGSWTEYYVKEHALLSVGGKECLYINLQLTEDQDWTNQTVYVPFPEVDRVVSVWGWGHADKAELLKIAQSITLTETGETVPVSDLYTWSDFLAYKESEYAMYEDGDTGESDEPVLAVTAEEMKNVHQIGETVSLENEQEGAYPLQARVTDVQILDDLSVLTAAEQMPYGWTDMVGKDGKLGQATMQSIVCGDGQTSLDEVRDRWQEDLKLVYVTVEYANPGETDMQDVWFFGDLKRIGRTETGYAFLPEGREGADAVVPEEDVWIGLGEMQYYDVTGGERNNNYIPEIRAGETQTVHMGWLVPEEEADQLYLDINADGALGFTPEMLDKGLVKLN